MVNFIIIKNDYSKFTQIKIVPIQVILNFNLLINDFKIIKRCYRSCIEGKY